MTPPAEASTPSSNAGARIDWGHGRVIGFSVPAADAAGFDVVQLLLDEQCVVSAVANRSVFELARDLAGLPLPAREHSAFELRIPQACLLPGHLAGGALKLSLRTAKGQPIFDYDVAGPTELLRLIDGVPADLVYEVTFRHLSDGAVHGVVKDRHGIGGRPSLMCRFNEHPPEPLPLYETSGDGRVHLFAVPLRADRLASGTNQLQIVTPQGQPMASFPIQIGSTVVGETDRRVQLLEAEVAFLKHLVLNQTNEAMAARLALMKGEIVNICADMLSLQRTNLEREFFGSAASSSPAPASAKQA